MATLTGQPINTSYSGLIKTTDNGAIGAVAKGITDGNGNAINMEVLTGQINFPSGVIDFTGATVNGLPPAASGLESGTGTDSMQSAATLTTSAAIASADRTIAIGSGAQATAADGNAIGTNAQAKNSCIALGNSANAAGLYSSEAIAIGGAANANSYRGICIGNNSSTLGEGVAIGTFANAARTGDVAIGKSSSTAASGSGNTIALGVAAQVPNAVNAKALALQTNSTPTAGGIIMSDAGGTDRRINIDAAGGLQIDSTPVGGGGGAAGVSTYDSAPIVGPSAADEVFTEVLIPANTFGAGDIINFKALLACDYTGGGVTYLNAAFSTTTGVNGTAFGATASSTDRATMFDKTLVIITANGTGNGTAALSLDQSVDQNNNGKFAFPDGTNGIAIDWTQDVYVNLFGFVEGANSTAKPMYMNLTKIN
tara:strand:- start:70 stop:1347 length:1278 start_codon:yes stop_codon:yes gene_type:complete